MTKVIFKVAKADFRDYVSVELFYGSREMTKLIDIYPLFSLDGRIKDTKKQLVKKLIRELKDEDQIANIFKNHTGVDQSATDYVEKKLYKNV